MIKNRLFVMILALAMIMITACAPAAGPFPVFGGDEEPADADMPITTPGRAERGQSAFLDEIDVLIMESFPVQVNVVLRGNLPDGCTYLDDIEVVREENTFRLTIWTLRDPDAMCTMALVPFEETVSLDVYGLAAGEYIVIAADITESFRLDVDNLPRE